MDSHGRESLYVIVAEQLRQQITDGMYPPGRILPSQRELAELMKVSRELIKDAVQLLVNEGLIHPTSHDATSKYMVTSPLKQQEITLPPSAQVTARMPTHSERRELGIGLGVPLIVVSSSSRTGSDALYPANKYKLIVSS